MKKYVLLVNGAIATDGRPTNSVMLAKTIYGYAGVCPAHAEVKSSLTSDPATPPSVVRGRCRSPGFFPTLLVLYYFHEAARSHFPGYGIIC